MPITALPTPPSTSSPSNFDTRADAFLGALPTFATEANALQSDVNAKQLLAAQSVLDAADQVALATTQAANAANSATAAFASANVTKWISGTTYTEGSVVWSPTSFYSYRRKTTGAGTTDPASDTNWSLLTLPALGTGGTSITGSVILTNSSAAAMTVTPTGFGLGATLPDATTCQKGTNLFLITNEGEYDYALYDKSGAKLGFISPKSTVSVGLSDNSTLAGTWVRSNLSRWGILANLRNSTLTNSGNVQQVVQIDSTRSFVLFGGSTLYGVIYDSSLANPFGSVVTIRAVADNNYNRALLTSATQITVISCLTTALEVVTITLTGGVGLTLNSGTKASATLAGNISSLADFVAVGSSFVFGYSRASSVQAIRGLSISGTTPTIGTENVLSGVTNSGMPYILVSGTNIRTLSYSTGNIYCKPFTISGATLTAGTEASITVSAFPLKTFLNGNGNVVVIYDNTGAYATIFKLTGTVEAASTALITNSVSPANQVTDVFVISNSKFAVVTGATSGTDLYVNIITDTAGTASAGTQYSYTAPANLAGASVYTSSGNTLKVYGSCTGTASPYQLTIDCSGTSPSLTNVVTYISRDATAVAAASSRTLQRSAQAIISNGVSSNITGGSIVMYGTNGAYFNLVPNNISLSSNAIDPNLTSAIWTSVVSGGVTTIQRIEGVL